jgi:hypothetical protein
MPLLDQGVERALGETNNALLRYPEKEFEGGLRATLIQGEHRTRKVGFRSERLWLRVDGMSKTFSTASGQKTDSLYSTML